MASVPQVDPVALGVTSSIVISVLLTIPLLRIFYCTRSRPHSSAWKAIYVPRTWWPEPNQRVHRVFHPLPGGSFFNFIFILLKGSTLRLTPSQQSSKQKDDDSAFMTDEEIHLRFLALCLRLALLALILGLPTFIGLFVAGVPPSPTSLVVTSVENLTILRLLHHYDLAPDAYSSRLVVWAIFALLIGSVLAFFLVLSEWRFLRRYIRQFSREKCSGLQIVYLPCKPRSGFDKVGEKKMANWVRACGLGPVGAEGNGVAIGSERLSTSRTTPKSRNIKLTLHGKKNLEDSDTDLLRTPDNTGYVHSGEQQTTSTNTEAPLPSEKRGVIIQAIFTISQLDSLDSLSEKRKKVLTDLELNEAKYVAGFRPEETSFPLKRFKRSKSKKTRGKFNGENLMEEQVTPYGPLGLYKLEPTPREPSGRYGGHSSFRLSRLEQKLRTMPSQADVEIPEVVDSVFQFKEIIDDIQLTNEVYRHKWNIGDEVKQMSDGTYLNAASDAPDETISIGEPLSTDNLTTEVKVLEQTQPVLGDAAETSTIRTSRSSIADSPTDPWKQLGRSTPTTIASTQDTHTYPPAPSTAPTSPLYNPTDGRHTPKEDPVLVGQAEISNSDVVQQEARLRVRQSFPEEHAGKQNLGAVPPLTQSASSPNLIATLKSTEPLKDSFDTSSEKTPIIPHLLTLPETIQTRNSPRIEIVSVVKNDFKTITPSNPHKIPDRRTQERLKNTSQDIKPKPHRFSSSKQIERLYHSIRQNRSQLKRLNLDFLNEKRKAIKEMEEGLNGSVCGWIIVGKGVGLMDGALPIDGMTREDVIWENLGKTRLLSCNGSFWVLFGGIFLIVAIIIFPVTILGLAGTPELAQRFSVFVTLQEQGGLRLGLVSTTVPCVILCLLLFSSISAISHLSIKFSGLPSKSAGQLLCIKAIFVLICGCFLCWFLICGTLFGRILPVKGDSGIVDKFTKTMSAISNSFLAFQCILAIGVPTVILVQPKRWKQVRDSLNSVQTPRERVKSLWPPHINSALCRGAALMGASVLLVFSSVAPLTILPSVFFFGFLASVQRRNIYFVYRREGQSGGKIELHMVAMLAALLALHSIFLALIMSSRQQWALATLAGGIALFIIAISALLLIQDSNFAKRNILPPQSQRALKVFEAGPGDTNFDTESAANDSNTAKSSEKNHPFLALFRLIDSTLKTSEVKVHRPVPLLGETIDDLVDTRDALHKYPDAPPQLPFLSWGSTQPLTRWSLYQPVLLQTSPAIWLPKDGIAADEAHDLKKYWGLDACF